MREENAKLIEQREILKKSLGILSETPRQRYARIESMSGEHNVAWLCGRCGVSRSGYYDWRQRRAQPVRAGAGNHALLQRIREEFVASRPAPTAVRAWRVHWAARVGATASRG